MIDCFLRKASSLPITTRLMIKTQRLPVRYNAGELSLRVSPLPLDAHRRVSRLMMKTQRLPVRYNAGELSLRVSPLSLDAHRRFSRLVPKPKAPCEVQCMGALTESLTTTS